MVYACVTLKMGRKCSVTENRVGSVAEDVGLLQSTRRWVGARGHLSLQVLVFQLQMMSALVL